MLKEMITQIANTTKQFGPFAQFIIIILISFLVAYIVRIILKVYIKRLTKMTKTDIDDKILAIITKPIYISIILAGIYIATLTSNYFSTYVYYIHATFFIIYSFIAAYVTSKIISLIVRRALKVQKKYEKTPQLINKIISIVIYIIAFLIILSYFNVDITPVVAGLGIGGLAIGLALQSTLSDFFAGLHILTDKPIRVGDYVEIGKDLSGFVEDIGWRSTKIRTLPNNIIVVPNSKLAESIITNYSMPNEEMGLVIQCGVDYTSDLEKVEKVTIEVAKEIQKKIQGAVSDFEPFVRFHTFGDSNINFSIILRVEKPVDKYLVTHEFIKALKKRFDKEGIEISWPVRKIYQMK